MELFASGTLERHWIGEALIWVLRVHLLVRLGIKIGDLSASVTAKPAFQQIVQELSALAAPQPRQIRATAGRGSQ